jgi:1-acyl-sn-glycerol-3-phosphate acyltransferase
LRHHLDRALAGLARFVLSVFFRRVEILGTERIPATGPLIVVANHQNGLVDPVLVLAHLGRPVRLLAKSTLWKIPVLSSLLDLAAAIPVHRREDRGSDPGANLETFARCHELLAKGGALAIFPEGTSHDRPALQPLKSGAARIALEAEARFGPLGLRILPVGLLFEEKTAFRSRALVVVGEPIAAAPPTAGESAAAARALTAAVEEGLRRVTLNFESWDEARLIDRAAELFAGEELGLPGGRSLGEEFGRQQALLAGSDELATRHPERIAALTSAVAGYDRLLRAARLTDAQVVAGRALLPAFGTLLRALARLFLRLPVALLGIAANALPYQLARLAALPMRSQPNQVATYKLFPSLLLYPLTWIGEALAAGWLLGGGAAWVTLLLAPASGWVALRFLEEQERLRREVRAFLLLRTRRSLHALLRARREAIRSELQALARQASAASAARSSSRSTS